VAELVQGAGLLSRSQQARPRSGRGFNGGKTAGHIPPPAPFLSDLWQVISPLAFFSVELVPFNIAPCYMHTYVYPGFRIQLHTAPAFGQPLTST